MNKKSGTAGTPVTPIDPAAPHDADVADPGEVEDVKAEQQQTQSGKYGSVPVKPFKAPSGAGADAGPNQDQTPPADDEKKTSWIEIELVGDDDQPIPGEKYRITLPDGTVDEGTLDQNGWARVEGFTAGDCKITFPDLDQEAWKFIESAGSKLATA